MTLEAAQTAIAEVPANEGDPDAVQAAMHRLFFLYVPEPTRVASKGCLAERLRTTKYDKVDRLRLVARRRGHQSKRRSVALDPGSRLPQVDR